MKQNRNTMLFVLFCVLFLLTNSFALPVGDPRVADKNSLSSRINATVDQGVHEISLHTYMGASKIDYPDVGGTNFSPGFGAAFSYSYFFLPRWSIMIGGGLQLFNNRGTDLDEDFNGYIETHDDIDKGKMGPVTLFYDVKGYEETQWSLMFMIPVMFQYQTNENRNKAFYYAAGVKFGFPFAGAYKGTAGNARTCAYYGDYSAPLTPGYNYASCMADDQNMVIKDDPNMGYGNHGKVSSSEKLKLSSPFFAAVEAGVKWRLYNKLSVYTGFWLDWALNDVAVKSVSAPIEWEAWAPESEGDGIKPRSDLVFRSRTTGRAIPMSLGFTVRFALGAGNRYAVSDSVRWMRMVSERDSLLAACNDRNKLLEDSLSRMERVTETILDSLIQCRSNSMIQQSREQLKRQADSLAQLRMQQELAAIREKARLDSIANAERLERDREGRLADYKKRLGSISNGLDDYKVTQTMPSDKAREKLDTAAVLLQDYPDLRIRITGHTCDNGTHESNVRFGMQRAEGAKNYLVGTKNIDASRIEITTKAEEEPVVPNTSEANRRKNRRVEIEIIEGAAKTESSVMEGK